MHFLSYLEHSICWLKEPIAFGNELLMYWIIYKQEQNILITHIVIVNSHDMLYVFILKLR